MNGYSERAAYLITWNQKGYAHETEVDALVSAELICRALSAQSDVTDNVMLTNTYSGKQKAYRAGDLLWSDRDV